MAVPRAQVGGMYGSGVFPTAQHQIDVSGAINAIAGGASSLIHGAYVRKMGQLNYALQLKRLEQEGELHKAQLDALTAYRAAQLGNAGERVKQGEERIAAPGARATQQQKNAFTTLQKQFPDHSLVAPNDDGTPAEFDPNTNYVLPLKDAMTVKAKADAETAKHADQLDTLNKAAQLRAWVNTQNDKLKASLKGNTPPSAAQTRAAKNDFLGRLATLSGGDPDKAEAMLASDKDVAAAASKFGVQGYEARAAAAALGKKDATTATGQNIRLESSGMVPSSQPGAPPSAADVNRARSGLTVPSAGNGIAPLVTPKGAARTGPASATAPWNPLPPPAPGPVPQTPAPLATPGTRSAPAAPAAAVVPAPLLTPVVPGATPPAAAPPAKPVTPAVPKAVDESTLGHHDLWNLKVQQGMKPQDATAYVLKAKGPQVAPPAAAPAPAVVVPKPDDEDAPAAPAGV